MSFASEAKDAYGTFSGVRKQVDDSRQKKLEAARMKYYEARSDLYDSSGNVTAGSDYGGYDDVQSFAGGGAVVDPEDMPTDEDLPSAPANDAGLPLPARPTGLRAAPAPVPAGSPAPAAISMPTDNEPGRRAANVIRPQDQNKAAYQGKASQYDHVEGTLGMALHGGLMALQKMFGLDQGGQPQVTGAIPTDEPQAQGQAPNARGLQALATHEGAMSPQEFQQVRSIVDPKNVLDDHMKNIAGLNSLYEFYLRKGDPVGAAKAAASMLQTLNMVSSRMGASAVSAIESGNYPDAAKILKKAYDFIPDGNTIEAEAGPDGNGKIQVKDSRGKVTYAGNFTPEQLLDAATGVKNGTAFWKQLVSSADKYLGKDSQFKEDDNTLGDAISSIGTGGADATTPSASPATTTPAAAPAGPPAAGAPATPAAPVPGAAPELPTTEAEAVATDATKKVVSGGGPTAAADASNSSIKVDDRPEVQRQKFVDAWATDRLSIVNPTGYDMPDKVYEPAAPKYETVRQDKLDTLKSRADINSYRSAVARYNKDLDDAYKIENKKYEDYKTEFQKRAWKPLNYDTAPHVADIKTSVTDTLLKSGGFESDAKPFADEDAMKKYYGEANVKTINQLAMTLFRDNPNLRDPEAAADAAIAMSVNHKQPGMPNFNLLGITPGGNGVVLELKTGGQLVLERSAFKSVVMTNANLSAMALKTQAKEGGDTKASDARWKSIEEAGAVAWNKIKEKMFDMGVGPRSGTTPKAGPTPTLTKVQPPQDVMRKKLPTPVTPSPDIPGQHAPVTNTHGFAGLEGVPVQPTPPAPAQAIPSPDLPGQHAPVNQRGYAGAGGMPPARAGYGGSTLIESIMQAIQPAVGGGSPDIPGQFVHPNTRGFAGADGVPQPPQGYPPDTPPPRQSALPLPAGAPPAYPGAAIPGDTSYDPRTPPRDYPEAQYQPRDGHWYIKNPAHETNQNAYPWLRVK